MDIVFVEIVLSKLCKHVPLLLESEESTELSQEILEDEVLVDLHYHLLRKLAHDELLFLIGQKLILLILPLVKEKFLNLMLHVIFKSSTHVKSSYLEDELIKVLTIVVLRVDFVNFVYHVEKLASH